MVIIGVNINLNGIFKNKDNCMIGKMLALVGILLLNFSVHVQASDGPSMFNCFCLCSRAHDRIHVEKDTVHEDNSSSLSTHVPRFNNNNKHDLGAKAFTQHLSRKQKTNIEKPHQISIEGLIKEFELELEERLTRDNCPLNLYECSEIVKKDHQYNLYLQYMRLYFFDAELMNEVTKNSKNGDEQKTIETHDDLVAKQVEFQRKQYEFRNLPIDRNIAKLFLALDMQNNSVTL